MKQLNPLEELLYTFYDFSEESQNDKSRVLLTSSEVLRQIGYDKPTQAQATQMGKLLIKATGIKPKRVSFMNKHSLLLKSKSTY